MYKRIAEVSDEIGGDYHVGARGFKFFEEAGEFSVEVAIAIGISGKQPGPDGVIGEAADVVITCLDIVHRLNPELTEEQFMEVLEKKMAKWKKVAQVAK